MATNEHDANLDELRSLWESFSEDLSEVEQETEILLQETEALGKALVTINENQRDMQEQLDKMMKVVQGIMEALLIIEETVFDREEN